MPNFFELQYAKVLDSFMNHENVHYEPLCKQFQQETCVFLYSKVKSTLI